MIQKLIQLLNYFVELILLSIIQITKSMQSKFKVLFMPGAHAATCDRDVLVNVGRGIHPTKPDTTGPL